MSRSWAAGSTYAWRRTRADVLAANAVQHAGRCQLDVGVLCQRHGRPCAGVCTGQATVVHHARGKAHGDRLDDLVPSCGACNGHVGNPASINPEPRPTTKW